MITIRRNTCRFSDECLNVLQPRYGDIDACPVSDHRSGLEPLYLGADWQRHFSWLYAFNVINSRNQFVNAIGSFLFNVTEPVLRPIRRVLPNLGGIDISPIIVLLIIFFIRSFMWNTLYPMFA